MLISAWILVVSMAPYSGYNSFVSYSPPLETLEDCKRLSKSLDTKLITGGYSKSSCTQVKMYIGAQK